MTGQGKMFSLYRYAIEQLQKGNIILIYQPHNFHCAYLKKCNSKNCLFRLKCSLL